MKVLFDHQIFGWQEYGGIGRYAVELASSLSVVTDCKVSIIAPLYINKYLAEAPSTLQIHGVSVPSFHRCGRIYRFLNFWMSRVFIRRFRPDIVHETYYSKFATSSGSSKTVLTVYDMIHEKFQENFSLADPTIREKEAAIRRADHIICISDNTKKDLMDIYSVSSENISVVYPGISQSNEVTVKETCDNQVRPFLFYVGSRAGYKNFSSFITAVAGSAALIEKYDIVCFGGGAFSHAELEKIRALGFSAGQVKQVSGSDEMLIRLYANATAFIYPSIYEGFGIPPLEAMREGCPVVCSCTSSLPEVVGDAAEMFDPYSTSDIRKSIERVLDSEDLRRVLIARGKERARQFSTAKCAQDTLSVYRVVLQK